MRVWQLEANDLLADLLLGPDVVSFTPSTGIQGLSGGFEDLVNPARTVSNSRTYSRTCSGRSQNDPQQDPQPRTRQSGKRPPKTCREIMSWKGLMPELLHLHECDKPTTEEEWNTIIEKLHSYANANCETMQNVCASYDLRDFKKLCTSSACKRQIRKVKEKSALPEKDAHMGAANSTGPTKRKH